MKGDVAYLAQRFYLEENGKETDDDVEFLTSSPDPYYYTNIKKIIYFEVE